MTSEGVRRCNRKPRSRTDLAAAAHYRVAYSILSVQKNMVVFFHANSVKQAKKIGQANRLQHNGTIHIRGGHTMQPQTP